MLWLIGACVLIYAVVYLFALVFLDCNLELAFKEYFGKSIESLRGKVVFITGASSGIGEYSAYALAKRGVKLVLAARRLNELERVKEKCLQLANNSLGGGDILILEMDMCDLSRHEELFNHAVDHFGQVDILFNNAGRSQRAVWENIEISVDKEMFELNVFSVINLTRIALKHFNIRGNGHVVTTSSCAGLFGISHSASYTGSKHAIHGYMNSLRNEKQGTGIKVTLICPGPVFSNFLQNSFTEACGEKFGVTMKPSDNRMTTERCAELIGISIANQLDETWIALFPFIPIVYLNLYFPLLFKLIFNLVGSERMYRLRDNRKLDFQK